MAWGWCFSVRSASPNGRIADASVLPPCMTLDLSHASSLYLSVFSRNRRGFLLSFVYLILINSWVMAVSWLTKAMTLEMITTRVSGGEALPVNQSHGDFAPPFFWIFFPKVPVVYVCSY